MQFFKAFVTVLVAMTVTVFAAPLNPQPLPPGVHIDPDVVPECTHSAEKANW
jgi:hypothetical protein